MFGSRFLSGIFIYPKYTRSTSVDLIKLGLGACSRFGISSWPKLLHCKQVKQETCFYINVKHLYIFWLVLCMFWESNPDVIGWLARFINRLQGVMQKKSDKLPNFFVGMNEGKIFWQGFDWSVLTKYCSFVCLLARFL